MGCFNDGEDTVQKWEQELQQPCDEVCYNDEEHIWTNVLCGVLVIAY